MSGTHDYNTCIMGRSAVSNSQWDGGNVASEAHGVTVSSVVDPFVNSSVGATGDGLSAWAIQTVMHGVTNGVSLAAPYNIDILGSTRTAWYRGAYDAASVSTNPPAITVQPQPQTVLVGTPANFSVTATGDGTLAYQWTTSGTNISGATSSAFTGTLATAQTNTLYVSISSEYGGLTSPGAIWAATNASGASGAWALGALRSKRLRGL